MASVELLAREAALPQPESHRAASDEINRRITEAPFTSVDVIANVIDRSPLTDRSWQDVVSDSHPSSGSFAAFHTIKIVWPA